jgi:hypothetical protein
MSKISSYFANKQKGDGEAWKKYVAIVEKQQNSWLMKCKLCEHQFNGRSTRALAHLRGESGHGVQKCTSITAEQQLELSDSNSLSIESSSAPKLAPKALDQFYRL